tara:strand:- start:813 stop:995 length:183 start_codon:yes stop_codon:yes gene_type:complete
MTLEERLAQTPPSVSKANLKGGDKTKLEADGGLDLSKNESVLKQARGGKLNTKPYTDSHK